MRGTLAVILFVLLLRVPFLNQAIQGDDVNYLGAAQYAQTDPAHPHRVWFIFQGERVTMQGHPHPPLNAWVQSAILAVTKDVREPVYHTVYLGFSLLAGLAGLSLARRFSKHPFTATLLFLATPAFIVNGNSLESDLPFLAFWLASIALFVKAVDNRSAKWLLATALVIPFAAMAAFQSIVLVPILALYLYHAKSNWKPAWAIVLVVPAVLGGWQLFEKLTSAQLPAEVLTRYFTTYNLQSLSNKLRNAGALTVHLGAMVFPSLPLAVFKPLLAAIPPLAGLGALAWCVKHFRNFLAAWVLLFFAFALIVFFAGSARYLLPIALPVAILIVDRVPRPWAVVAIVLQTSLGLALAKVNFDHWDGYRTIVAAASKDWDDKRVWVDGEMGLRFYAESAGALPLVRGQAVRPGDVVISSKLLLPTGFHTGGGTRVPLSETSIHSAVPLRIIGLDSQSAYSSVSTGFLPFDRQSTPIDIVRIDTIAERKPTLSLLPMNAPEASLQIVSGIDQLEENRYRWMAKRAVLLLKSPSVPTPLHVEFFLPEQAVGRNVTVTVDGEQVGAGSYAKSASYTITTSPLQPKNESAIVTIEVDKTFQAPGDQRTLGMILVAVGFR